MISVFGIYFPTETSIQIADCAKTNLFSVLRFTFISVLLIVIPPLISYIFLNNSMDIGKRIIAKLVLEMRASSPWVFICG